MKHISQNRGKTKPLQRRIFYYAFSVRRWNCNCKGSAWTVIVLNAHSFGRVCTDRDLRIRIFPFFRKVAVQACHLLRTALFLSLDGILEPWSTRTTRATQDSAWFKSVCKHSHPVLCLYYQPRRKSRIYHVTFHHCLWSEVSAIGSAIFFLRSQNSQFGSCFAVWL